MNRRDVLVAIASFTGMALASPAIAKKSQVRHDAALAKKEYLKLLDALLSGNPDQIAAFEPITITFEKKRVEKSGYALLQKTLTENNGRKDERPAKLKNFDRTKWDHDGKPVYQANIDRSAWFEEQDYTGIDGEYIPEGYSYMFELWFVIFDGPRISALVHNISMA